MTTLLLPQHNPPVLLILSRWACLYRCGACATQIRRKFPKLSIRWEMDEDMCDPFCQVTYRMQHCAALVCQRLSLSHTCTHCGVCVCVCVHQMMVRCTTLLQMASVWR